MQWLKGEQGIHLRISASSYEPINVQKQLHCDSHTSLGAAQLDFATLFLSLYFSSIFQNFQKSSVVTSRILLFFKSWTVRALQILNVTLLCHIPTRRHSYHYTGFSCMTFVSSQGCHNKTTWYLGSTSPFHLRFLVPQNLYFNLHSMAAASLPSFC